jgi:hypothetical protein|uniref:Uncharacterized protein n=2 Tax=Viruses TaxID=10239 RepID=A0A8S5ULG3_9VIRU|nr:MAG TPA: hypothetical protein [Phage sp. ctOz71]DAG02869.1 MAG TPA: hypothetical protein [Siphoviridae sp. ctsUl6]
MSYRRKETTALILLFFIVFVLSLVAMSSAAVVVIIICKIFSISNIIQGVAIVVVVNSLIMTATLIGRELVER